MENVLIPMTQEELRTAEEYAKSHSLSLETAFKLAFFEKIKSEYRIESTPGEHNEGGFLSDSLVGMLNSNINEEKVKTERMARFADTRSLDK